MVTSRRKLLQKVTMARRFVGHGIRNKDRQQQTLWLVDERDPSSRSRC